MVAEFYTTTITFIQKKYISELFFHRTIMHLNKIGTQINKRIGCSGHKDVRGNLNDEDSIR